MYPHSNSFGMTVALAFGIWLPLGLLCIVCFWAVSKNKFLLVFGKVPISSELLHKIGLLIEILDWTQSSSFLALYFAFIYCTKFIFGFPLLFDLIWVRGHMTKQIFLKCLFLQWQCNSLACVIVCGLGKEKTKRWISCSFGQMFVSLLCCDVQHRTRSNLWSITTKLVAQRYNQCMCLVRARYCRFEALTMEQLLDVFGSVCRSWTLAAVYFVHCNKGVVPHLLSFTICVQTFVVKLIWMSDWVAACIVSLWTPKQ